jgi:atypical dual specificity phosphatase
VRRRILDGRQEEITAISANLYETRLDAGTHGTSHADWVQAEKVAISRTFQRWLETDVGIIEMETALLKREFELKSQNHTAAGDGNNNSYPH